MGVKSWVGYTGGGGGGWTAPELPGILPTVMPCTTKLPTFKI